MPAGLETVELIENHPLEPDRPGAEPVLKHVGKRKKATMLKKVEISNFVADNEIREAAGLKKIKTKRQWPSVPSASLVPSEEPTRKGVRKEKKPTVLKKKILKAREHNEPACSTNNNTSFSSTPLDESVIELLKKLRKQKDAKHEENPVRARTMRTFFCGLHECLKHVKADNVKCIVLARNLDAEVTSGISLFHCLREECLSRSIPIVHASTKRLLSRALEKFPYTNVVALFHFQGFEVSFILHLEVIIVKIIIYLIVRVI
ncbi:ribosomal protein L7Ae [Ancylostoma caninum]|uniref:Ribosomal protein L7Ae n=1 Tax=Ancylostoma caninum TaxID=29170 RepID=A0A368FSN4_ANCCA|nr:ribosomal protein L7Ae [Ancylostoma caninum]